MVTIIKNKLQDEQKSGHTKFIVDGFRRSEDAAQAFEDEVSGPLQRSLRTETLLVPWFWTSFGKDGAC